MVEKGEYYLGQRTPGKIVAPFAGFRVYYKPSLGKIVFRAAGVMRRSPKLVEINKKFAAIKPASACKGLPWKKFVACLRKQLKGKL